MKKNGGQLTSVARERAGKRDGQVDVPSAAAIGNVRTDRWTIVVRLPDMDRIPFAVRSITGTYRISERISDAVKVVRCTPALDLRTYMSASTRRRACAHDTGSGSRTAKVVSRALSSSLQREIATSTEETSQHLDRSQEETKRGRQRLTGRPHVEDVLPDGNNSEEGVHVSVRSDRKR